MFCASWGDIMGQDEMAAPEKITIGGWLFECRPNLLRFRRTIFHWLVRIIILGVLSAFGLFTGAAGVLLLRRSVMELLDDWRNANAGILIGGVFLAPLGIGLLCYAAYSCVVELMTGCAWHEIDRVNQCVRVGGRVIVPLDRLTMVTVKHTRWMSDSSPMEKDYYVELVFGDNGIAPIRVAPLLLLQGGAERIAQVIERFLGGDSDELEAKQVGRQG